ncbi:MAG TPA: diadenylate cyclase CdaA [Candidatus Omnitrophota bacterium]|nr:diadenylate cyclase CdaA [Candidatus Omnitrophota bacterium]HOX10304.1 diadenylate cyclase CdaA [Candidatus Omnitrophota bacterium]HPN66593.1 diadenylate cyclase CdaA [Candidatus Omnitrophota bacterium]HRZ67256.1 diadenylate cyclase CdaA [Candidatus Omnitrophota bacterium]
MVDLLFDFSQAKTPMQLIIVVWKPIIEIGIIWYIIYKLLEFVRGTRAVQVLRGIIIIAVIFLLTQQMRFDVINWIFTKLFALSVIAFLIVFQPELRSGLARIGREKVFGNIITEERTIEEIAKSVSILARKKIGAIIAIEREVSLEPYTESGVALDGSITSELLNTIFMPNTPLHDGGVVVHGDRIVAAGCLFPLSQSPDISKLLGTRHRSAIGLTEETDAVCVVVSEETGIISVANAGKLTRDLDRERLINHLRALLYRPKKEKKPHVKFTVNNFFRKK